MQTELLKVTGMTCGACISNVTKALKAINGVGDVKVSLSAGEATVQFNERLTSPEQLKKRSKSWNGYQRTGFGCCSSAG